MYVGYVILPGNCSTFRFWYENCCRPGNINNYRVVSLGKFNPDSQYFDLASEAIEYSEIYS